MSIQRGGAATRRIAASVVIAGSCLVPATASAEPSGDITVWSWDIAAKGLEATVASFNEKYPDVDVTIMDVGNGQVFDRMLAGCASGGVGLPDVITVENQEAEIFWSRFPDCATDLHTLGYDEKTASSFPDFKRTELEVGDKAYAMPWDSGPVVAFYRRDLYEAAGVDPADIETWDDFIAAGAKIEAANDGVVMTQADVNAQVEFFQMIGQQHGCSMFSADGSTVTVASPACVETMDVVRKLWDSGTMTAADWGTKIQSAAAGKVATHLYGGWYEGTIRTNMPAEQSGKWGVYAIPAVSAGEARASNLGGSSLAVPSASKNPEAAYAFILNALGTVDGQITMMREQGLVPSLTAALDDPYVAEGQPFWGGQAIWVDILETLPEIKPISNTPFLSDAVSILTAIQLKLFDGEYESTEAALDDAANQMTISTGLPIE